MSVRSDLLVLTILLLPTPGCQLTGNHQPKTSRDAGNSRVPHVLHPTDSPRCMTDTDCPMGLVCVCANDRCSVRHWASGEGEKYEHFCTIPVNEAEPKQATDPLLVVP